MKRRFIAFLVIFTVAIIGCRPKEVKKVEVVSTTPIIKSEAIKEPAMLREECLKLYKKSSIDADANGQIDMCDPAGIWVSTEEGSDKSGDGTLEKPLKSIGAALKSITDTRDRIYVVEGTYSESNVINLPVIMVGGYSPIKDGVRTHDPKRHETVLSPSKDGKFSIKFEGPGKKGAAQISNFVMGVLWKQVPAIILVEDASPIIKGNTINVGGGAVSTIGVQVNGASRPLIEDNEIVLHGSTSDRGYAIGVEGISSGAEKKLAITLNKNRIRVTSMTGSVGTVVGVSLRKEDDKSTASLEMSGNNLVCEGQNCSAKVFIGILLGESVYGSSFSYDDALINGNRFSQIVSQSGDRSSAIYSVKGSGYLSNNIFQGSSTDSVHSPLIYFKGSQYELDFNSIVMEGSGSAISLVGGSQLSLKDNIIYTKSGTPIYLTGSNNSLRMLHNNLFAAESASCLVRTSECLDSFEKVRDILKANVAANRLGEPLLDGECNITSTQSAAVDAGHCLPNLITKRDIRGTKRPVGSACDIGAVEFVQE